MLFSSQLVKAIEMEGWKKVTANCYITKCLPEMIQEVDVRGLMLTPDNASSHTAIEFLEQKHM